MTICSRAKHHGRIAISTAPTADQWLTTMPDAILKESAAAFFLGQSPVALK